MFEARAQVVVAAEPQEILEFVLDIRRYAEADHKFSRIKEVHRDGDEGFVRHGGRLRGLPGPMLTSRFRLERWRRLRFEADHALLRFDGGFECTPVEGGTLVEHDECFAFRGPAKWLDPFFAGWLQRDLVDEMARLKVLVEASSPGSSRGEAGAQPDQRGR